MKQLLLIICLALVAFSCKKESPIGPNVADNFGYLKIQEQFATNLDSVDFTKDSIQFKGRWTINTPWKITIKGRTSGAIKTIVGNTKTVDTLVSIWKGTADGIFFKKEICDVKLSFDNYADSTRTATIKITNTHNFKNDGVLLSDFEKDMFYNGTSIRKTKDTIPQGNSFYYIEGTEPGSSISIVNGVDVTIGAKYYLGGFGSFTSTTGNYFQFGTSNASNVYLNFFARGYNFIDTYLTFSFKVDTESFTQRVKVPLQGWAKMNFALDKVLNDNTKSKTTIDISKIKEIDV